ncbi:MAG TPA: hypothetical protein VGL86_01225 [Polyangia bacterium]
MGTRAALLLAGVDSAESLEAALALAARTGATVTIAPEAEAMVALARRQPELVARARAAFADGRLAAMLACAHGAEAALLGREELADELRLAEETLQLVFGVALERRGFVGAAADVTALEEAGVDFVIGDDAEPCRIGERLMALPVAVCDARAIEDAEWIVRMHADAGERVVGADAWAAMLTPPWLMRGERTAETPPAALRALAALGDWVAGAFGLRRVPGVAAAALVDEGWKLERFPARARVPLVRRRGLCASRRAWVAAYEWCDVLAVEARVPGLAAHAQHALDESVLRALRAMAEAHGAGEPMARAEAAYEELRGFGFVGGLRWRALLSSLRDAFALLASRRQVDWSVEAAAPRVAEAPRTLRLIEPTIPLN